MTTFYPAIIETGEGDGYSVFFPDLPGCTSAGDTQQEAAENAAEALLMHLRGMIEDKEVLPAPSRLDELEVDPEVKEAGRILVAAGPFQLERVNVSFDGLLLQQIDQISRRLGQTRSEFLAVGAKREIARLEDQKRTA